MSTLEIREAVKKRKLHEARFAQEQVLARGRIITRNGSTAVQGLKDHVWVTPQGDQEPLAVYNRNVKGNRNNLGVYIGFAPGSSILEILRSDVESTAGFTDTAGLDLQNHASSHLVGEGDDPLFIYARAVVMLLTYPGSGLTVKVSPYSYLRDGQLVRFSGSLAYDLSSHEPSAGLARWVLVGLNVQTGALSAVAGDTAVDTLSITPPFPTIPADVVASAYVRLAGGQTEFLETRDFIDARDFLDKPRRISSLAAADGDPAIAWEVDDDGNFSNVGGGVLDLTGVADALVLDADNDTSLSSPTDDQIDVQVGGADVARFVPAGLLIVSSKKIDLDGNELILDVDADTSITADTDDQIDLRAGGADIARITSAGVTLPTIGDDYFADGDIYGMWARRVNYGFAPDEHWRQNSDELSWTGWAAYTGFTTPDTIATSNSIYQVAHSTGTTKAFRYRAASTGAHIFLRSRLSITQICVAGVMIDDGVDDGDGEGATNFYRAYISQASGGASIQIIQQSRTGGGAVTTNTATFLAVPAAFGGLGVNSTGTRWTNWSGQAFVVGEAGRNVLFNTTTGLTWTPARVGLYVTFAGTNATRIALFDWYDEATS